MAKQMRVGVKAAWIISILGLVGVIITVLFSKGKTNNETNDQKIEKQKIDSGSINNYNAGGDIKIENNYNQANSASDSFKKSDTIIKYIMATPAQPNINQKTTIKEQTNVTSNNQTGGQTAKEIINNNN